MPKLEALINRPAVPADGTLAQTLDPITGVVRAGVVNVPVVTVGLVNDGVVRATDALTVGLG
jgi:hypothetical protein